MALLGSNRLVAALALIATLLLGILLGVAGDRRLRHDRRSGPPFGRGGPPTAEQIEGMRRRTLTTMSRELSLTDGQRRVVDSVFRTQESRLDSVRRKVRPAMDSLRAETRAAIDRILTPEQRTKAEAFRARMERRRGGRGGPPGMP
jgi:Spy/CpxP family protein refolding chaperone